MMMAKADEGSSMIMDGFVSTDDGSDDVLIDLDSFWEVMGGEPSDPDQGRLEDFSFNNSNQGSQNSIATTTSLMRAEFPEVGVLSHSNYSEALDHRNASLDGLSESGWTSISPNNERVQPTSQLSSEENICSRSINDHIPFQGNDLLYTYSDGGSQIAASYFQNDDLYDKKSMEESDLGISFAQKQDLYIIDREMSSYDTSHTDSSSCEVTGADVQDILSENGELCFLSPGNPSYFSPTNQQLPYISEITTIANDDGRMVHMMDKEDNTMEELISLTPFMDKVGGELGQHRANCGSVSSVSLNRGIQLNEFGENLVLENELRQHSPNTLPNVRRKIQDHIRFEKHIGAFTSSDKVSRGSEVIDFFNRKYYGSAGELSATEVMKKPSSNSLSSVSFKNHVSRANNEKEDTLVRSKRKPLTCSSISETRINNPTNVAHEWLQVLQESEQHATLQNRSIKREFNCLKVENSVPNCNGSYLPKTPDQRLQNNLYEQNNADDDCDLYIIEDMSAPARSSPVTMNANLVVSSQSLTSRIPINQIVTAHSRLKPNAEQVIFRVALQDLSQAKSEATPPDGFLAVSLLKHQRIALSWMVNKETKSACCSGGILADDQGLGKTISTIALILKERSSSSKEPKTIEEQSEAETLNLDDDDDREDAKSPQVYGSHINRGQAHLQSKGRPAAGTLIVCPTSVLRQWSDELHNRVTTAADLSVLVYHGSNRTKDPLEVAKYDVVLTTYAIVSMEVPKQPVVNENDDQTGAPFKGFSSGKKRELLETMSDKKPSRSKKRNRGIDEELYESISGPLAKVGWFRVVLDEAQSIKNHRTQVARACWGLRAKRRWCLSGTPMQNAVDDLYSYFRFLRHDPYAVFKTFCEHLKTPIHKNPKDGYKKLQAVLKTIMLRRTKGTLLDGEPIIDLPPKTIEMKKVDFSHEERDFYSRLEAESRAQFAVYAAAGTVKQNYVNILLMLLRLRQACDHPLLVKGFDSNSKMNSSIEVAKKLPREKQIFLLNCLEASLAICGICKDPPDDAVVTVCGHVYCNQCICQLIIGDDAQCVSKSCKTHLSLSNIFSITSLRISLSDQLDMENTPTCSDSVLAEVNEPCSLSRPEGSSKIKAALELLSSLSKPYRCPSRILSSDPLEQGACSEKLHARDSGEDNQNSDINRNSNLAKFVGEKAIVFSQWTRMLDLLEACLKKSSIQYRRLDGTMPVVARDRAVKDFNSLPEVSVMIMSLKAASLGLNMVAACHVILLDLWWNPTTEDQAIDRAHRIGQTRPVSVFRLTVKDTVEDRILALQQRKREMVAAAFGEDETGGRQTRLTVEDLKYLFRVN
ncbi:helicase-like transcription factor CHR28 isoform X1 [Primulina eburnea]|uniref:helicase-like transcription factor CHR28 isoform X1 n=2 Tax=Primulina eburnea TaxID=1245227 RepID=UPI003C6BE3D2